MGKSLLDMAEGDEQGALTEVVEIVLAMASWSTMAGTTAAMVHGSAGQDRIKTEEPQFLRPPL